MSEKIINQGQSKPSRLERFLGTMGMVPMARGDLRLGNLDETETLSGVPIGTIGEGLEASLEESAAEHDVFKVTRAADEKVL